jgi:hypothetical protein
MLLSAKEIALVFSTRFSCHADPEKSQQLIPKVDVSLRKSFCFVNAVFNSKRLSFLQVRVNPHKNIFVSSVSSPR